jgi:acetyl-CoA acetyltransferase
MKAYVVGVGTTSFESRDPRLAVLSGGLISKGHPLGATGLAQAAGLVRQLRGEAGPRQVDGARTGLAHNIGLGGAAVVTLLRRSRS